MYDTYILHVKYMYITHELKCGIHVVYICTLYIYTFTHVSHMKCLTREKTYGSHMYILYIYLRIEC